MGRSPTPAVLEIRDLKKSFGALQATNGVHLDLRAGEIHALIGPNGAGKTTLVHQVCGQIRPDSGTIHFLGNDLAGLGVAARARRGLARSFQVSSLVMEFSVLRNVMLSVQGRSGSNFQFFKPVLSDKRLMIPAHAALERVGLGHRAHDPASALSHGERRQLEIAMALGMEPKAFLFDEPMAGMGPDGSLFLTALLDRLREDAPILLVEHDMDAVFALADRISVLVDGRLIATGTGTEIRKDRAVRQAYLGENS